ncbi:hypothetical protein BC829DRAFT_470395 [Chytridium lagenaria]|nr:hypothetical protein BC829DRAFT_470395 [Chytridium lagenaria]
MAAAAGARQSKSLREKSLEQLKADADEDDEDTRSLKPKEPPHGPVSGGKIPSFQMDRSSSNALGKIVNSPVMHLTDIAESDDEEEEEEDPSHRYRAFGRKQQEMQRQQQTFVTRTIFDDDDDDDDSSWSARLSRSSSNSRLAESTWAAAYGSITNANGSSTGAGSSDLPNGSLAPPTEARRPSLADSLAPSTRRPRADDTHSPAGESFPTLAISSAASTSLPTFTTVVSSTHLRSPQLSSSTGLTPQTTTLSPAAVSATTALTLATASATASPNPSAPQAHHQHYHHHNRHSYTSPSAVSTATTKSTASPLPSYSSLATASTASLIDATLLASAIAPRTLTKAEIKKIRRTSTLSQASNRSGKMSISHATAAQHHHHHNGLDSEDRFLLAVQERLDLLDFFDREASARAAASAAQSGSRRSAVSSFFGVTSLGGRSSSSSSSASIISTSSDIAANNPLTPPDSPPMVSSPSSASSRISPLPSKWVPHAHAAALAAQQQQQQRASLSSSPGSGGAFSFFSDILSRAFGATGGVGGQQPSRSQLVGPTLSRTRSPVPTGMASPRQQASRAGNNGTTASRRASSSSCWWDRHVIDCIGTSAPSYAASVVSLFTGGSGTLQQQQRGVTNTVGFVAHGYGMVPMIPVCAGHTRERLRQACHLFELGDWRRLRLRLRGRCWMGSIGAVCVSAVNERQALGHLSLAARDGEHLAMYELGNYYRHGRTSSTSSNTSSPSSSRSSSPFSSGADDDNDSRRVSLSGESDAEDHRRHGFDEDEEDEDFEYLDGGHGQPASNTRRASFDGSFHAVKNVRRVGSVVGARSGSIVGRRRAGSSASAAAALVDHRAFLGDHEVPALFHKKRKGGKKSDQQIHRRTRSTASLVGTVQPSSVFATPPPLVKTLTEPERRSWMMRWFMAGAESGHADSRIAAAECILANAAGNEKCDRKMAAEFLRIAAEQKGFVQQQLVPAMGVSANLHYHHHQQQLGRGEGDAGGSWRKTWAGGAEKTVEKSEGRRMVKHRRSKSDIKA